MICRRSIAVLAATALLAAASALMVAGWQRSALLAPAPTLLLLDRQGAYLGQLGGGESGDVGYWRLDPVPERVVAAVVAIEDRRFALHPGVDPLAMLRALGQRLTGAGRSGASTIAMQVARMQDPGPRTLWRKGLEAATATAMILRHGRTAVLEHYLRLVPFGNGSHGIAHAARWYLDKPVEDLSWAEIAFLCAIPQSPARMNPFSDEGRRRAIRRGHAILSALGRDGVISPAERALAEGQIERIGPPHREVRPASALHAVFHLQRELRRRHYAGNPRVQATLDLGLQRQVSDLAAVHMTEWRERGAEQVSVVLLDRASREVLAWVGSSDYFSRRAGAIDFATVSRSPGSALKPFLYALALERGRINANTILADLPDRVWGIENADHDYLGPLLPRQALANSRNVPAAWLVRQQGLDESYLFLNALGLHNGSAAAARFGLVLAVGALPTTLERLVRAYGALADDGRLLDLAWWTGEPRDEPRPVISAAAARQITLFLSDPAARLPSFPRLGASEDGLPIAVKTGTSQGYRDAWAVAWTGRYLVGVWTGRIRGASMRSVSGAQSSAQLAQTVLIGLHRHLGDTTTERAFPPPAGYRPVALCAETGLRAVGRCARTITEWFPDGQVPEEDDVFQHLRVDLRNGLLAAPWTPAGYVGERLFAALPSDLAAWGEAHHLPPPPLALSPLDRPDRPGRVPAAAAGSGSAASRRLTVVAPRDGLRMVRNPETPAEAALLNLRAVAGTGVDRLIWLVDGRPWRAAGPRDAVHWPLSPGRHRFEVTTPDGADRSPAVSIEVE
ncbi:MAG: transglycosylase domain-containing protein [Rhodospirillaceae bacterium]